MFLIKKNKDLLMAKYVRSYEFNQPDMLEAT